MSENIDITTLNGYGTTLAAVVNFPPDFDSSKQYPAIVVSHPGGGVKEQTAGLYAGKLAEYGFVTVAYDASFQGASTGEPRQLENPHIRTEDVSSVVDYLTTLDYVDNDRCDGHLRRCWLLRQCRDRRSADQSRGHGQPGQHRSDVPQRMDQRCCRC